MVPCILKNHNQLIKDFEKNLAKIKTNPKITHCMVKLLTNEEDYKSLLTKYGGDKDITHAINQQISIGATLLHHGKMAKVWAYAQKTYNKYQITPTNIHNWTTQIVNQLLNLSIQIWKTRNLLNNQENKEIPSSKIQRINTTIMQLYSKYQNKVKKSEEYLFKYTIRELITAPIRIKNKWLHALQHSILLYQPHDKKHQSNQTKITHYFRYTLS